MNIVINNQTKIEIFTTIFQHIKLFSDNVNIMFEKERLYLQTMDGSRVSIFELYMPSTWFDAYENKNNANVTIGLNSTMLFKILNTHEKGQLMNIVYDADDDKLLIRFHCDDKNIFDKNFESTVYLFEEHYAAEQQLKVKKSGTLKGEMQYMICDDTKCLPPISVPFTLEIN